MKLTIDLQDPEIQRQLQLAIDEKITAISAERVQAAIDGVIATKLERLDEKRLDQLVSNAINAGIKAKLEQRPGYNSPTAFQATLDREMRQIIRDGLGK